jgi:hypothetical protein
MNGVVKSGKGKLKSGKNAGGKGIKNCQFRRHAERGDGGSSCVQLGLSVLSAWEPVLISFPS